MIKMTKKKQVKKEERETKEFDWNFLGDPEYVANYFGGNVATDKEVFDFFFAGEPNFGDNALVVHHKEMAKECLEITRSKNHDYAGDQDPLRNFRMCEQFGVSMEKGILIRLTDKLSRIARLLDNPAEVKDESIHDTLADIVNYSMILDYALKERNDIS